MTGDRTCLIALAGLPGTGKSTLARALAAQFGAPVLDKDAVRAALFGPTRTDYSREQDDICMQAIFAAAAQLVRSGASPGAGPGARRGVAPAGAASVVAPTPRVAAILDGRTFSRHESVAALLDAARHAGAALLVVECRCAEAVAEARLLADAAQGTHPAANRGVELYRQLRDAAEPIATALAPAIAASRAASGEASRDGAAAAGVVPCDAPVAHLVLDTGDAAALGITAQVAAQVLRVGEALAALGSPPFEGRPPRGRTGSGPRKA